MKIKDIGEIKLIERFRKKIRVGKGVIKGSGDDAAVIECSKGKLLLFTSDMLVEDVHFRRKKATARQIGHKALAVNISDIAAMGGIPTHAVVSLGLPGRTEASFVDKMFLGMKLLADNFGINIVGGDVNSSGKLVINVALLGEAKRGRFVTRTGAKIGDIIMVTGSLGGSRLGKHLTFTPRVKESLFLTKNFKINSMIDLSDGLSLDLLRIARASKVGAVVYESLIPVSPKAESIKKALSDGEDFELLFTVPRKYACSILERFRKKHHVSITAIGEVTPASSGVNIIAFDGHSKALKNSGFTHF